MAARSAIGIVGGAGREGRGLAVRWARAGHAVTVGSRDAARAAAAAAELGHGVRGAANAEAVAQADVAVLAVPWSAHAATLAELAGALAGKLVIDLTVPLRPPRITVVAPPDGGAAALRTRAALPGARVAAALHHVSSARLGAWDGPIDCDVLVCADDDDARACVIALVNDLGGGVRGLDAGPLDNAIALESLTPVLLHLGRRYGAKAAGVRITGL